MTSWNMQETYINKLFYFLHTMKCGYFYFNYSLFFKKINIYKRLYFSYLPTHLALLLLFISSWKYNLPYGVIFLKNLIWISYTADKLAMISLHVLICKCLDCVLIFEGYFWLFMLYIFLKFFNFFIMFS